MACFASLGEEVKVWDAANHSMQDHFSLERDVTNICWDHDGVVLASCNKDNTINLHQFSGTKSISSHSFGLPSEASSLCIEYDSSSRYLACGCSNGALHIYNTNSMKIYKSFERHSFPITSVQWNWNDKNIALGSKHGEVFLYNVITEQASSPFKPMSTVAIQQLRYNPYRKASLVSANAMGVITLWDTNTRGHVHSFESSHQAPASDLVFSPVNDYLMLSVGLDKRLIFYDLQTRRSINTISADYPLTCVDMQDGSTIAVGTSRGKVLFYDMRMSSTPMSSFHAHKSSVKRITFNKKDQVTASSSSLQQMLSNESGHDHTNDENQNQNDDWSLISHQPEKMSTGLISPLADNSSVSNQSMSNSSALKNDLSFLNQMLGRGEDSISSKVTPGRKVSARNSVISSSLQSSSNMGACAGLFSPLQGDISSLTESSISMSFLKKLDNSFFAPKLAAAESREASIDPKVLPKEEDSLQESQTASGSLILTATVHPCTDAVLSSTVKSKSPPRDFSQRGVGASPSIHDLTSPSSNPEYSTETIITAFNSMKAEIKADINSMKTDINSMKTDINSMKSDMRAMMKQGSSGFGNKIISAGRSEVPSQGDLFRKIVSEELRQLEYKIHREFVENFKAIHRLYYIQKLAIEQGFSAMVINPALVEEIDNLEKEVKRLNSLY